jgi:hypothetical protein
MPFILKYMKTFIESQGKNNINPNLSAKKQIDPEIALVDA